MGTAGILVVVAAAALAMFHFQSFGNWRHEKEILPGLSLLAHKNRKRNSNKPAHLSDSFCESKKRSKMKSMSLMQFSLCSGGLTL